MKYNTYVSLFILCFYTVIVSSRETSAAPKVRNAAGKLILSLVLGIFTGLTCAALFAFTIRYLIRFLKRTPILKGPVVFSSKIAPRALQSALSTSNQSPLNPNTSYTKAILPNGLSVAVKTIDLSAGIDRSSKRRTQRDLETLASLRHPNVMSLRAFVWEHDDNVCLVYDLMVNGSLEDAMRRVREDEIELGWDARLRIAVGIVKGLAYLHFTCVPQILHGNLKPSNVLLDSEFEPRLADSGLPQLERVTSSAYTAPESALNGRYSDKSDVFSFGVVLGVLLTGREAMDVALAGGGSGGWLGHLRESGEAVDKRMMNIDSGGHEDEEMEMEMVMAVVDIALVCLSNSPSDRPCSDELVSMLTQLHSF